MRVNQLLEIEIQKSAITDFPTDRELVAAIQAGERRHLSELYDRYERRVYHKCLSLTKNAAVAQDLTHDIFIKIFTNIASYQGRADFSYWVYAIAYNHCMKHLRHRQKNLFGELDEQSVEIADEGSYELTTKMLREMQLQQLEHLLTVIKADEKLILLMRYQDGMSIKQIAHILDLGESAVKMRLKRCRDHLAELLTQSPLP